MCWLRHFVFFWDQIVPRGSMSAERLRATTFWIPAFAVPGFPASNRDPSKNTVSSANVPTISVTGTNGAVAEHDDPTRALELVSSTCSHGFALCLVHWPVKGWPFVRKHTLGHPVCQSRNPHTPEQAVFPKITVPLEQEAKVAVVRMHLVSVGVKEPHMIVRNAHSNSGNELVRTHDGVRTRAQTL